MAAFQELKPAFSKKISGYSPEEVDSYIVPLLAKQNALMQENDDLKKQLLEALHTLQPAKENAEKIQTAAKLAQEKADQIIGDAKAQAEFLVQSTKNACDAELEQFRVMIEQEMDVFLELRRMIHSFQEMVIAQYKEQLSQIERNANRLGALQHPDEAEFSKRVLQRIREDMIAKKQREKEANEIQERQNLRAAIDAERQNAASEQTKSKNVVWTETGKK